jgi:hypothetical protein
MPTVRGVTPSRLATSSLWMNNPLTSAGTVGFERLALIRGFAFISTYDEKFKMAEVRNKKAPVNTGANRVLKSSK